MHNNTYYPDLNTAIVGHEDIMIQSDNRGDTQSKIDTILKKLSTREMAVNVPTKYMNYYGLVVQDSHNKYLETDTHLNSSLFKEALKTPLHYFFAKNDKSDLIKLQEKKSYLELGTFVHQAILEPSKFSKLIIESQYSLSDNAGVAKAITFWEQTYFHLDNREEIFLELKKKAEIECGSLEKISGKRAYIRLLIANSEKIAVPDDVFFKIKMIKINIDRYGNGIIYDLFKHSKREISFYAEIDGLNQKVRPDAIQFEENIGLNAIISVKTTSTTDLRSFYNQCASFNYDLSEAMYQEVVSRVSNRNFNTTITLLIQTSAPYAVALLIWNDDDISVGRYKYEQAKIRIKEAELCNNHNGYDIYAEEGNRGIIAMQLPQWNNRELLPSN